MTYAISTVVLIFTILCFFAMARGRFASFGISQVVLQVVVALPLVVSGILLHFFRARLTASIIPPFFPGRLSLAVFTGICEIAGGIGLFVPRFRRAAAFWIAVMMVAIFPANVYSAGRVVAGFQFPSVPVRLVMQIVYIVLVLLAGYGMPKIRSDANSRP
jgi:uncharacterized membrane protein